MRKLPRRGVSAKVLPGLNLIGLVAALVGFVFPLTQMTPERFVLHAESLAASAGTSLSAAVPANPYNTLAEQLHDKEDALNQREAALDEREQAPKYTLGELLGFISFGFSIILCALIGYNFYLDARRGKKIGIFPNKFSVDLR